MAVDIKTKQVVSLEVSEDKTDDGEMLKPLVKKAKRKVKVQRVLGDGGYDSHESFKFLADEGLEAGIKVREDKTAVGQERGWCGPTSRTLQGGRSAPAMDSGGWPRRSSPDSSGSSVRWSQPRGSRGW